MIFAQDAADYGQPYARLEICAYMPRGEQTKMQIEMIEAGIRKEVSIGCSMQKEICSICGNDYWSIDCAHHRGKEYEGSRCFVRLENPTDAYEISFVAVPAQPAAGVVKHRAEETATRFSAELHELNKMVKSVAALLVEKQTAAPPAEQAQPQKTDDSPDTIGALINEANYLLKTMKGVLEE